MIYPNGRKICGAFIACGLEPQGIIAMDFRSLEEAKEYVRTFKLSKKHVNSIKNYKIFAITQENLKILFETKQLQEYELFYDEFY